MAELDQEVEYLPVADEDSEPVPENWIRFALPTTIAPKYAPNNAQIIAALQHSESVPYRLKLDVTLDMGNEAIATVKSPSHSISHFPVQSKSKARVFVERNTEVEMNQDFVLLTKLQQQNLANVVTEEYDGKQIGVEKYAIMVPIVSLTLIVTYFRYPMFP